MPLSIPHTSPAPHRRAAGAARGRLRGWLVWALLLLTWLPVRSMPAGPAQVQVLLSETGGAYSELLDALQQRLDAQAPGRVEVRSRLVPEDSEERAALFASQPALVVAIGIRASALALKEAGPLPVLSLLIPYDSYTSLVRTTAAGQPSASAQHSAIYLDQPLERQLDLLQLVLPKATRLATLAGPNSAQRVSELKRLSAQRDLQMATETVAASVNPVPALSRLLDRAEVLVALPDPAVFNRNTLQAILLTTYRSGVPVLGFSQAYVRAGALAAVHTTAGQIGTQAGEWIAELANIGRWQLGMPRYPGYYSVAVNAQVAQTLGINVADERTLLEQLRSLDRRDGGQKEGRIHEP